MDCIAIQSLCCDTAQARRVGGAARALSRRWARRRRARAARRRSEGRAAWACCWVVGCALGALSLFLTRFDSVLFLSQFLDIIHEPGS